ncbi:MAG: response regulator [Acidobacteria bacterium]|nr:response regulator [Acidobacteriota bacterium]
MPRPILIVEDDPDLAEGLRYNLERERFATRVAADGEQALGAALDPRDPPALILLDLMLPQMGGLELCRRLRQSLGPCGGRIETVTGVGYRFRPHAQESDVEAAPSVSGAFALDG